jgi:hypothetical protein
VAGSLSKTATPVRAQGHTQVAGMVTAAVTLLVTLVLAPLLRLTEQSVNTGNAAWSKAFSCYASVSRCSG